MLAVLAVAYGPVTPPRAVRASEYLLLLTLLPLMLPLRLLCLSRLTFATLHPCPQGKVWFSPFGMQNLDAGAKPNATWQGPHKLVFLLNEGNHSHPSTG